MLRYALLAATMFAVAIPASARPEPDFNGNWLLSFSPTASTESNYCIVKIETKNGKPTGTIVASQINGLAVSSVAISGKDITITLSNTPSFVGTMGNDPNKVLGSMGTEQVLYRGKLVRTDDDTLPPAAKAKVPEPFSTAQSLTTKVTLLRGQAAREKDAAKRKELQAEAAEAQKEADEKVPALYREVIADHPNDPAALDAAIALLTSGTRFKVTLAEARTLAKVVEKQATPYGPRFVRFTLVRVGGSLATQKELAPVAVDLLKPVVDGLTDKDPASAQVDLLNAYKTALEGAGKTDEVKTIDARLTKLESKLDAEYLATVPPFKPTVFAGRENKEANQVVVMELFTGAQCPPCVAADVAFDALGKSYKPTEVVLLQYHLHIPGPDPMTNADTIGRARYYSVNSTPSTFFNGKSQAGGGGGMAQSENKFGQYRKIIDPLLEQTTPIKLKGRVTRAADKVQIAVEVFEADPADELKLRLVVVEETVKFVGGNRLRFHHDVVRAMPGGVDGVTIKNKAFRHTETADVGVIRKGLTKYLDDFAANERPFPQLGRPMDMKELKVIALVQNDKTKEILQAVQFDLNSTSAGGQ